MKQVNQSLKEELELLKRRCALLREWLYAVQEFVGCDLCPEETEPFFEAKADDGEDLPGDANQDADYFIIFCDSEAADDPGLYYSGHAKGKARWTRSAKQAKRFPSYVLARRFAAGLVSEKPGENGTYGDPVTQAVGGDDE